MGEVITGEAVQAITAATNGATTPAPATTTDDLWKKRMDYAWEWFKFHAKQRTDMFNYFLIVTALLVNGYISLRKDGHWVLGFLISLIGICSAAGFYLLDCRNKSLIDRSAVVLDKIERESLYATMPEAWLCCPDKDDATSHPRYHHSYVFRSSQVIVGIMWALFALATVRNWWLGLSAPPIASPSPTVSASPTALGTKISPTPATPSPKRTP